MARVVPVFDLDDTLYPERTFVESGLRAVADAAVERQWVDDREAALQVMFDELERHGRGRVFDALLLEHGSHSRRNVDALVSVYRRHRPEIELPTATSLVLSALRQEGFTIDVVTDGNALVQESKVRALGLRDHVDRVYVTHRYGRAAAKPAPRVFELIAKRRGVDPEALVYVGDDPTKDFVGVRRLGGSTIRVRTGRLAALEPAAGYGPDHDVASLAEVLPIVRDLNH